MAAANDESAPPDEPTTPDSTGTDSADEAAAAAAPADKAAPPTDAAPPAEAAPPTDAAPLTDAAPPTDAASPTDTAPTESAPEPGAKPAPGDKAAPAKAAEPEAAQPPPPDPATCRGIVIGQEAFEQAVLAGEFDDSEFLYYLEPAGVLNADLVCTRDYPAENTRGGILMTHAARVAKVVYFDDGLNPDTYELGFPKEFGYVKSIQHYEPATREHAKYPWSKKY